MTALYLVSVSLDAGSSLTMHLTSTFADAMEVEGILRIRQLVIEVSLKVAVESKEV